MLEAGWNGTSGQRAVDYRENAATGYVKDILQESRTTVRLKDV